MPIPGLLGNDWYLQALHNWLKRIGYRPLASELRRNTGRIFKLATEIVPRRPKGRGGWSSNDAYGAQPRWRDCLSYCA